MSKQARLSAEDEKKENRNKKRNRNVKKADKQVSVWERAEAQLDNRHFLYTNDGGGEWEWICSLRVDEKLRLKIQFFFSLLLAVWADKYIGTYEMVESANRVRLSDFVYKNDLLCAVRR